jgi:uncharacterized membrane protein YdjX (TVP38/TMEM64 family)
VAAVVGYPLTHYFFALLLGALPYYFVLALVGQKFQVPTWIVIGLMGLVLVGVLIDRWWRRRRASSTP